MASGWDDARRILCVRLDALGDVLMTTPALRAIKESAPGRRLTLLTSPSGAAVARCIPEVDEALVYASPWMKATRPEAGSAADHAMIDRLRRGQFDAAAIFTVYSQNPLPAALLCLLADVPLRLAHCRENPYHLLTDWVPEQEPDRIVRHEVRRQLDLVQTVGCRTGNQHLSLRVDLRAAERVGFLLEEAGLDPGGRLVVVHPGATAPSRRYPAEQFAEAARRLALELDCSVVLTGSPEEAPLVEEVRASMRAPSHSFAGRLALPELIALIDLASLLVSNNSGPVHVAAAVGTPVVDLYALTNPQHTPWLVPNRVLFHDVPCRYCYKSICPRGHQDCLRLVPPDAIVAAARSLLDGAERWRPQEVLPPSPVPATLDLPLPVRGDKAS